MKRLLISLTMVMAAWTGANAMSYEMAREEALYLTDKLQILGDPVQYDRSVHDVMIRM